MGYNTYLNGTLTLDPQPEDSVLEAIAEHMAKAAYHLNVPSHVIVFTDKLDNDRKKLDISDDGRFYNLVDDLQWYITTYIEPLGLKVNGSIECDGEISDDFWQVRVEDNQVSYYHLVLNKDWHLPTQVDHDPREIPSLFFPDRDPMET
jgi:hypothetical protein